MLTRNQGVKKLINLRRKELLVFVKYYGVVSRLNKMGMIMEAIKFVNQ